MTTAIFARARRHGFLAGAALAPFLMAVSAAGVAHAADVGASSSGSAVDELVVTGAKEKGSLLEKRNDVAVSSVISAEEMTRRPVSNVVEALSILPGVSAYADMGLGQAATGEPEFVTIRGIDSSYNAYSLNGVRAPQSDPGSRALSLKLVPPFGLQSIKVVKSPTAEYDGDSIGGVVDIRTPTAYDFGGALTRITLRGDLADLAERRGLNGKGGAVQGEFARKFADGRFGVYATAYYEQKNSTGEAGEVAGWVPTEAFQSDVKDFTKVDSLSANSFKWDFYTNRIERFGGNVSVDYRTDAQTLYAQVTYGKYKDRGDDNQMNVRPGLANTGKDAAGHPLDYWGRPVGPGLPGDANYAPQQVNSNPGGGAYDASGFYSIPGSFAGHYFQLRDQESELITVKIGGSTKRDRLTFDYDLSYGYAKQARPNYVEASFYGLPIEGARYNIQWSDPHTPRIVFNSAAARDAIFSQDSNRLWKTQGSDSASDNGVWAGKFNVTYDAGGKTLRQLRAGLAYSASERSQYEHEFTGSDGDNLALLTPQGYASPYFNPAGPTIGALPGTNLSGAVLGSYPGVFRALDRSYYPGLITPHAYQDNFAIDPKTGLATWGNPGAYSINDYNRRSVSGDEKILAAYVSAELNFGPLSVYPGLRYEYTDYSATYWAVDGASGGFKSFGSDYGEVLPSVNLVYRTDNGLVYRGSIRRGFSRPAFGLLAQPASISRDPTNSNIILAISQGNPNLKPTESINYDASVEYYNQSGGLFEAAAYYKDINNFIYAASVTGAAPSSQTASLANAGVTISQPENGGSAKLMGVELNARQQLKFLPGPWSGLGVGVNATFQHSEADSKRADHFGRKTWLPRAPEQIFNIEAFYNYGSFSADLTYQYTGLQLVNLTSNNLDNYLQPTKFLNLSVGYVLNGVNFTLAAKNLTNEPVFWKTLGKSTRYLGTQDGGGNGSYVETGRVFSLTASYAW